MQPVGALSRRRTMGSRKTRRMLTRIVVRQSADPAHADPRPRSSSAKRVRRLAAGATQRFSWEPGCQLGGTGAPPSMDRDAPGDRGFGGSTPSAATLFARGLPKAPVGALSRGGSRYDLTGASLDHRPGRTVHLAMPVICEYLPM